MYVPAVEGCAAGSSAVVELRKELWGTTSRRRRRRDFQAKGVEAAYFRSSEYQKREPTSFNKLDDS